MKQSSKRLVSILLALVFMIGALVVLFDLIQPTYANVETLKGQVAGQQAFLDKEKQDIAKAQQLISDYQSQNQNAQNVALALPAGQDIAGALAQIYGLAQNNDVTIQAIAISAASLPTPTPQVGSVGAQAPVSITKPVGSYSLQITAVGSYESVKNFVSGIETNVRIFDIKGFSISQSAGGGIGKPVGPDNFSYNITVGAYYQTH